MAGSEFSNGWPLTWSCWSLKSSLQCSFPSCQPGKVAQSGLSVVSTSWGPCHSYPHPYWLSSPGLSACFVLLLCTHMPLLVLMSPGSTAQLSEPRQEQVFLSEDPAAVFSDLGLWDVRFRSSASLLRVWRRLAGSQLESQSPATALSVCLKVFRGSGKVSEAG